jgi:hypothetical protein
VLPFATPLSRTWSVSHNGSAQGCVDHPRPT